MAAKHIDYVSPRGRRQYRAMVRRFRLGVIAEFTLMVATVTCLSLVSASVILTTYEGIARVADQQAQQRLDEELSAWQEESEPTDGKSPLYIKYLKGQDFVAISQEEQEGESEEHPEEGSGDSDEEHEDEADDEEPEEPEGESDEGEQEPDSEPEE